LTARAGVVLFQGNRAQRLVGEQIAAKSIPARARGKFVSLDKVSH